MSEYEISSGVLVRCNAPSSEVIIPDNVKEIGKYAFALNDTVRRVILPKGCKIIGKGAFYKCSCLETVYAQEAEKISDSAFESCKALSEIYLGKNLKNIGNHVFDNCFLLSVIATEKGAAEKYARENNIFFKSCQRDITENEKISVAELAKKNEKAQKIKPMLNLNMLILGGSGTGKSRFFVKPNVMQCNTSYVITDPSAELIASCGKMLERMGYDIKVFNIDQMEYSCNYNPFCYVFDRKGECDKNAVIKMVNTFMINTKGEGQSGDPFWEDCTRLLLSAVCFYLIETSDINACNFSTVLDIIHMAKVDEDKKSEMSEFDALFEGRKLVEPNAMSVQYYVEFKQAAGKTMQSILISTTTRLQYFKLEKVRNLTYTDNIGLDTLGDKKTALFIIIPSTDTTYNFLAAMMYTQLFDVLYRRAISNGGRLDNHVRFILDEFANNGKIPDFEKILATCRKFEISVQVILQNLSQLKRLYEKSWEEIPGNCDTTIFLGGKDQTNNEYIMKELGKETIDTMNVNKTKSKQGSTSYNDGIMGRELMQLDELATMPNNECLVLIRGLRPFRTDKYDIMNHPRYNMLDEANKKLNIYRLEENIETRVELENVTFDDYINAAYNSEDGEIKYEEYKIYAVYEDGTKIVSRAEMEKEIPSKVRSIFAGIGNMYSESITISGAA